MEKHPDHQASFEYPKDRYVVQLGDSVIVDTTAAILLKESSPRGTLPPVLYFPVADTQKEYLVPTDHHTFCPLKGEASYYNLKRNGETHENAVWTYPQPLDWVTEIDGYLAFYPDKVTIGRVG